MTKEQGQKIKEERLGTTRLNKHNEEMKVIEYNSNADITVEFQDEYKTHVHTAWDNFVKGGVRNPYRKSIFGVGVIGEKYPISINSTFLKEYKTWAGILQRCFDSKKKIELPTYKEATICDEWLLYENFYEWLHNQENFDKWLNGDKWNIDKDIIVKGNKLYSPETCCLVPGYVNIIFTKRNNYRGDYPIGVYKPKNSNKYKARCHVGTGEKDRTIGYFNTCEEAFNAYKNVKEKYIKEVAQEEYKLGNITKACYEAMMKYEVEITD